MRQQRATYPRIGAQDTFPIFPLKNITSKECAELAEEIGVLVIFLGENARIEERKALEYYFRLEGFRSDQILETHLMGI